VGLNRLLDLVQLDQAALVLLTHCVGSDTGRKGATDLLAEVTPNTTEAKDMATGVAFDLMDRGPGCQRPIAGLGCGDLQLTLVAEVDQSGGFVAITIAGVVGIHGMLSFIQVEMDGALPLAGVPRMGWKCAKVKIDPVRSNGSEHLESVFVESNGFLKQLQERRFGKPAECRFLFQLNAQSAQK
jgi:hypothetical protein